MKDKRVKRKDEESVEVKIKIFLGSGTRRAGPSKSRYLVSSNLGSSGERSFLKGNSQPIEQGRSHTTEDRRERSIGRGRVNSSHL
jgi:hypothetical protein